MRAALLLAAGASLALAGCNDADRNRNGAGGVAGICKPFIGAASAPGDPSFATDDCLHRWGYTLARATDAADVVADAVVAACAAPLSRWNQESLGGEGAGRLQSAPSLVTGEDTNPIQAHASFAQGRALFYVVQARAGKCEPPKAEPREKAASTTNTSPDR